MMVTTGKHGFAGSDRLSRFIIWIVRLLVTLFLWPVFLPKAEGGRFEPEEEGCILIANHHHILDPIFITFFYQSARLSFVAKQELYRMKLIGRILKAFQAIPLDRSTADIRASKMILGQIKAGRVVGIFLQGTRVKLAEAASVIPHAAILYYAIRRGIPVLPVAIDPRYRLFGRPRYLFDPPARYELRNRKPLDRQEQEAVAREFMRRLYERVGLAYDYEGAEENRALFEERITIRPLGPGERLVVGGK